MVLGRLYHVAAHRGAESRAAFNVIDDAFFVFGVLIDIKIFLF